MAKFTHEEIELLKKYVTDPVGNVFCVTNLAGLTGAAYARYSRAKGGFREVLLKEFIKEGVVDHQHASELIQRVLIAYGDDSVGELEGAHLSFEEISILATKEIEECRIGGSPIEQSTRYVFYDQKDDRGKYRYYTDPAIAKSSQAKIYTETMDSLFHTYCDLIEPMQEYYRQIKTLEQAEYDIKGQGTKQRWVDLTDPADQKAFKRTYQSDIRTRACDALRAILPLATRTNVGLFGNGRFFQSMLSSLYSSSLPEANMLGNAAQAQLNQVMPVYIRRAEANAYQQECEQRQQELSEEYLKHIKPMSDEPVALYDNGASYLAHCLAGQVVTLDLVKKTMNEIRDQLTLALMLYPTSQHPLNQLVKIVGQMTHEQRQKLINGYVGNRRNRRDRPYRAFESGYDYTFDLVTDFGVYKDLMRHRMTSQLRQRFSPLLGFNMPPDIIDAGHEYRVRECHDLSVNLYNTLVKDFPIAASYATLHGSNVRWLMAFNEREAYHLLELRTTPQGHSGYRRVAQMMHQKIKERSAWRAGLMKFVDYHEYQWARGDAEAKQRVKEKDLYKMIGYSDNP